MSVLLLFTDGWGSAAAQGKKLSKSEQKVVRQSAYIKGLAAFENEQYQESLQLLKRVYNEEPENAAFSFALAEVYENMDKLSQAHSYAKKSVTLNPNNKWYRLKLAGICKSQGEMECAITQTNTALKSHPKNTMLLKKLAIYYKEDGQLLESNKTYRKLLFLQGENIDLRLQRLKNFNELDLRDSVLTELKNIQQRYPQNIATRRLLGSWYLQMGLNNKAKQLLQKTDQAADRSKNRLELIDIYFNESQWDSAGTLLKQFASDTTVDANKRAEVGKRLLGKVKKGKEEAELRNLANSYFRRLMQTAPQSAKVQELAADFFINANSEKRALRALAQVTEINPANDSAWKKRLQLLFEGAHIEQTIRVGKEALEAIPQDPLILYYLGRAEQFDDKFKSAIETLKKASLLPARRSLKTKILSSLGHNYFAVKQWNNAFQRYEEALQVNPKNIEVLNTYAYHLAERKQKLEKARQMARNALEIDPDNASVRATLGWVFYQQKKYKQAEQFMRSAIDSGSPTADMMEHLGDTMLKRNRPKQAVQWWKRALQKDSTRTYLNEKISTARDS